MSDFGRFFLPGPTEVRPKILKAMLQPMIGHRTEQFAAMHRQIVQGLQMVFRTHRPVYVASSSATGLMEMAIRGCPEGPILSLVNGSFAERFARIAQVCGRRTRVLTVPWGDTHPLEMVEQHLAAESFVAMTVVQSETSTGALADVRALTELAHRYGVMCLVDSVTGVAALPVETEAWGLDFVLTASQKSLALPPGLAFAVASEAYILQAASVPDRGRYFDPVEYEEAGLDDGTPTTPALPLLYAAQAQLADIAKEGIETRWARHGMMLAEVETFVDAQRDRGRALTFLARPGERSPSVSCLALPGELSAKAVVSGMSERGYTIARGYGQRKDSTIRIGHMGDHTVAGLRGCLAALDETLGALTA
ncbi:MAG: alanine--glyoxylate aminotransferase family protein [Gemmatimonadaceae bacterium]|nr:alanine--glyoxylate aminotransferase family protein [Gemmatimonadaceae bacterium]